jgi:hypothetical protein
MASRRPHKACRRTWTLGNTRLYISPHPADPHCSNKQLDGAIKSARRARRLRWTCFTIILIIVLAIAIFLAIYFTIGGGKPKPPSSNNNTRTS